MPEVMEEIVEDQDNTEEVQVSEKDLPDMTNLTDEEVDKLINNEPLAEDEETETDKSADTPVEEGDADVQPDKEEADLTKDPEKEEVKEDDAETGEMINVSKAEWDKMQTHAETQAKFDQRRNTEVGDLRSKIKVLTEANLKALPPSDEYTQVERDRLEELFATDSLEWDRYKTQLKEEKKSVRESLINEQIEQQTTYERAFLEELSPNWEDNKETVRAYLESAGIFTAQGASDFSNNPSGFAQGGMFYRIAQDAASNESLKAEVVSLKEKLKTMQSNIAANASKSRTMGNLGTSTTDADDEDAISLDAVENMSEAELDKLIKKG